MMDEFTPWPKPYLLLPTTCGEILSWMIEIWIKKNLVSDINCKHRKSITPTPKKLLINNKLIKLQGMTSKCRVNISCDDTTLWFTIKIEQDN